MKRSQDLEKQKKYLSREDKKAYSELSKYNIAIEQHFFWQERDQVALLMKNFLTEKIDSKVFCGQVSGLRRRLINTRKKFLLELLSSLEKMKDFQPDERAKKLSGLLTTLYCECECFADADDYQDKEFYDFIKSVFLNFQKAIK